MLSNDAQTQPRTEPTSTEDSTLPESAASESLVSLLGEQRSQVVEELRRGGEATVCHLAGVLGISEVATRRHLKVLEEQGMLNARDVATGPGRPARHYRLTDRALRLFPQHAAEIADELLEFIAAEHGREGVRAYLSWRLERQAAELADALSADDLSDRLEQLAQVLTGAGFDATVDEAGDRFELRQHHCAILDVAREHPEMCAWEAATFAKVLGQDVKLSRRQTRTQGDDTCVCCITPVAEDANAEQLLPVIDSVHD